MSDRRGKLAVAVDLAAIIIATAVLAAMLYVAYLAAEYSS